MPKFTRELEELLANNVITSEVADKIRAYYERPSSGSNRMVIAFGIIGALLVGMGVVLIIAHNWDNLPTPAKLFVGFAPMITAQAIAAVLIYKNSESSAWREAVSVILIFAVATSIAVVSQVYNIHGNFERFLLVWCALSLPIMYVLRSWMASLLFWIGLTWYASEAGIGLFKENHPPSYYWPMAIAALPYYILLIRRRPDSNAIAFHSWIIGISVTIVLALGDYSDGEDLLIPAYITLFSVYLLMGQLPHFASRKLLTNAWLIGGSAGTILLLLFMTFEWPDLASKSREWWISAPLFLWIFLFVVASVLLFIVGKRIGFRNVLSKSYTFIIFLVLFFIGLSNPLISRALTNILILALGVYTIREGALADKLWKMNYGLVILSILIGCRFFDTDMSFVIRGLLFVGIGVGFFGMNYYMMRKRKAVA